MHRNVLKREGGFDLYEDIYDDVVSGFPQTAATGRNSAPRGAATGKSVSGTLQNAKEINFGFLHSLPSRTSSRLTYRTREVIPLETKEMNNKKKRIAHAVRLQRTSAYTSVTSLARASLGQYAPAYLN